MKRPCVSGSFAIIRLPAILIACSLVLTGAALPEYGPVPIERPDDTSSSMPEERKTTTTDAGDGEKEPTQSPDDEKATQQEQERPDGKQAEKAEAETTEVVKEDENALQACQAALRAAGATFKPAARVDDGSQCGMDRPIELSAIAPGIAVEPAAQIRCETALALSRWTTEAVVPALDAGLSGEKLVSLQQASGYVCRNRNGAANGKISEHALGNAIDIASFTFESGKSLAIAPRETDSTLEGAFQRAVVAAACLYFATVLDPGSDAAHETHLHLDVKARRNGYRYCW